MKVTKKRIREIIEDLNVISSYDYEDGCSIDNACYYLEEAYLNNNKLIKVSMTKDDMGQEEWWCSWFKCPNCKKEWIYSGHKYCPNCGKKIKWVD